MPPEFTNSVSTVSVHDASLMVLREANPGGIRPDAGDLGVLAPQANFWRIWSVWAAKLSVSGAKIGILAPELAKFGYS